MNHNAHDEYEEVESPFAPRPAATKLRNKKNVFNRPFAAEPASAPAVFESSSRRTVGGVDSTALTQHRTSELADTEIEYLEEGEEELEEEVVEKRPARTSTKKQSKLKKNLLAKLGWTAIALLVLRLISMDRGVWDYFATEGTIREKRQELRSIQQENRDLAGEITRIQMDKNYQRQLAKEHLGVIAADEFLILFAGESADSATDEARRL